VEVSCHILSYLSSGDWVYDFDTLPSGCIATPLPIRVSTTTKSQYYSIAVILLMWKYKYVV